MLPDSGPVVCSVRQGSEGNDQWQLCQMCRMMWRMAYARPKHFPCSKCGAEVGEECRGGRKTLYHGERLRAAQNARRSKAKRKGAERPRTGVGKGGLLPADLKVLAEGFDRCGVSSLAEYWESDHWQRVKARFAAQTDIPKCCHVCGKRFYQLHHRSYKRLGAEWMTDLVPLCALHHEAAHDLLLARTPGVTLWNCHKHVPQPRYMFGDIELRPDIS